jgi:membrane-associated phospholipid phosphatase
LTGTIDERLREDLRQFADGGAKRDAIALGRLAATMTLGMRADDGASHPEPIVGVDYLASDRPGEWRPDPISRVPVALGAHWGAVRPFVLRSPDQFRVPPPPALDSAEYAAAFDEVTLLGGDGVRTATGRTADETVAGIYWAYDGMPSLCAPPRLYNQIAVRIADDRGVDGVELARLLALVNVALADAGTAVWESKYHFRFWRPVTAIREADAGSARSGIGDGNAFTRGDPTFTPLGAPASNSSGPNFTPPFPSYPSGHAGFGGALFQVLRRFFGTDQIAFTFVSDEMDGRTRGPDGELRPLVSRRFLSLSQAEEENGQSRIYLGIHWSFDKTAGIRQGRQVGDAVFDSMFQPLP